LQKVLGIVKRNKLNPKFQTQELKDLLNLTSKVKYRSALDPQEADHFGPKMKDCLKLQLKRPVQFIGRDADVQKLGLLQGK